jgi:hypothetical protein
VDIRIKKLRFNDEVVVPAVVLFLALEILLAEISPETDFPGSFSIL